MISIFGWFRFASVWFDRLNLMNSANGSDWALEQRTIIPYLTHTRHTAYMKPSMKHKFWNRVELIFQVCSFFHCTLIDNVSSSLCFPNHFSFSFFSKFWCYVYYAFFSEDTILFSVSVRFGLSLHYMLLFHNQKWKKVIMKTVKIGARVNAAHGFILHISMTLLVLPF